MFPVDGLRADASSPFEINLVTDLTIPEVIDLLDINNIIFR
jgi:hypothetical protein